MRALHSISSTIPLRLGACIALATVALETACSDGSASHSATAPAAASKPASSASTSAPTASSTPSSSSAATSNPASASTASTSPTDATPASQAPAPKPNPPAPKAEPIARYGYEVVHSYPHDPAAYTQGLLFANGMLYESTGLYGASSIRRIIPPTGQIINRVDFPEKVFSEGIALFDGKLYMLTWKSQLGVICDPNTFQQISQFQYSGEGWGLTNDATSLIMSDGTSTLRFLDPQTMAVTRTIEVKQDGKPIDQLNELEFVKGEIYSNVWKSDRILRIDPKDGRVTGVIDLKGIFPPKPGGDIDDVLNGIAFDATADRLFVTGKRWSRVFEIKLVKK